MDSRHPVLDYYPNRCVLCGICVRVCRQQHQHSLLSFAGRGFDTVVGYFNAGPGRCCGLRVLPGMPRILPHRGAGSTGGRERITHGQNSCDRR